jgi:hypothetical protein
MDLSMNGLTNMLKKNAGLLGNAAGLVGVWGLDPLLNNINDVVSGKVHMPNLANTVKAFFEDKNKDVIVATAVLYLGGEVIGGGNGKALKDFGKGLLTGNAIQHLLYWATTEDEGCREPGFKRPSAGGSINGQAVPYPY